MTHSATAQPNTRRSSRFSGSTATTFRVIERRSILQGLGRHLVAAHAVGVEGAKAVRHPVRQQRRHLIHCDAFCCSDGTRTALGGELRHADPDGLGARAEMSHVGDCCMHRAGE